MKLVIFGLTISSSWGNGHATLWRGLIRALARNGALLAIAAFAAALGPGPSISTWVAQRSAAELVAIALGLLAGVLVVLLLRSRRKNNRL